MAPPVHGHPDQGVSGVGNRVSSLPLQPGSRAGGGNRPAPGFFPEETQWRINAPSKDAWGKGVTSLN